MAPMFITNYRYQGNASVLNEDGGGGGGGGVRLNNIWPGTERKGTEGRERERGRDVARDGELDDEGGGW